MGFLNKLKSLSFPEKKKTDDEKKRDRKLQLGRLLIRVRDNENDTEAFYLIGKMYLWDIYVGINPPEALKWFLKAAAQGHSASCWFLGYMHEENHTFDPHRYGMFCPEEAFSWYKKGAMMGCSRCQNIVAMKYEKGEGVSKNLVQAYRWYAMSGDSKYWLEGLRKKMTDNELKETRDLLAMCNISEDKT